MKQIQIFDTTLRDGEQAPGFAMSKEQKLLFAKKLQSLGVNVIEAGFSNSSKEDFLSIELIAKECRETEICAIARCKKQDIEAAIQSLKQAALPRIHLFIGVSDLHMKIKLKMGPEKVIEHAKRSIKQAKTFTSQVQFSPEDATRADRAFLVQIIEAAIAAGAKIINIPDTVGFTTPWEYADLLEYIQKHTKGIEKVSLSTHCHNDLGLAVANSLAAVLKGVSQVECTVSGIGERAGNAALEEVVMAMKTRKDLFLKDTSIQTEKLLSTSRLLSQITLHPIPPNKAIVGDNTFVHGSGVHQGGVLLDKKTYEIMDPKEVGFEKSQVVLTKHSGKNAILSRLKELDLHLDPLLFDQLLISFKALSEKRKILLNEDLIQLVQQVLKNHF